MKWLYALLVIVVLWLAVDTKAEFSSGRSASTPGSTRFIDQDHLVQLSESGVFEVIAPDTLEFTASYQVLNRSPERTVTGITLTDSLGLSLDPDLYQLVVVDAPSKVAGPATVTANGSWTGYEGATQLLDGSNSLGPREAMTISYKVRFIADWFQGDWAYFDIGPHLGGSVGAGEINGSNDLGFGIPFTECVDAVSAGSYVNVIASSATQTEVELHWFMANPNLPGCIGIEPECSPNPDLLWEGNCNEGLLGSVSCMFDTLGVGFGTSTWEFGTLSDGPGGGLNLVAVSADLSGDGAAPSCSPRLDWVLNPDLGPLATVNNLGAAEWVHVAASILITHNGTTTWTDRLWTGCLCSSCPDPCFLSTASELTFSAFPIPQIAGRMTVGTPVVDGSGYAMPCSVFVKNTGGAVIEKINSHWILADAFPATSSLTSVSGLASKLFTVNSSFNGDDNDSLLMGDPADELSVGEVDTLTFTANFEEGDQTSWSSKASVNCEPDGGGAAEIDTTNCGPDYGEGDGEPNEDGDNAACAWSISTPGDRLEWSDLTYEGAFSMPYATMSTHSCGAASWWPAGDPGNVDAWPGSLIVGKSNASGDAQRSFAEISIPEPLITTDYDLLPVATLLDGPTQVNGSQNYSDAEVYYTGSEWRLWTVRHNNQDHNSVNYQHMMMTLPLTGSTTYGSWAVDYPTRNTYETNWYVIGIDSTWAALHANGRRLGVGRCSEGRGHQGFNLYAFSPLTMDVGSLPAANTSLPGSTLLMQWEDRGGTNGGEFDEPEDIEEWMESHAPPDFYNGGAWMGGTKQALVISLKNKVYGQWFYGWKEGIYPNATDWIPDSLWCYTGEPDCQDIWDSKYHQWVGPREGFEVMPKECCKEPDTNPPCQHCPGDGGSRGPSGDRYHQELLFFDTNDIALVADGLMDPLELEPYLRVNWESYMFRYSDPTMSSPCHLEEYTGYSGPYSGGALAWDADNRKLYVTEYTGSCRAGAGGSKAGIIHVWGVAGTSP